MDPEQIANLTASGILRTILLIILGVLAAAVLTTIINYVINALGIFLLAKKLDVNLSWLAWIPVAQYFTLGKVAEKCDKRRGITPRPWAKIVLFGSIGTIIVYIVLCVVNIIVSIIPFIGLILGFLITALIMLITLVPLVLNNICRWKIYRECYPKIVNVVLFIVGIVFFVQTIITLIASFCKLQPAKDDVIENVEYSVAE